MSRKKELSPEQRAECEAAKALFMSKKGPLGLTQAKLADAAEISPAAVAMYLNGTNPLNARFASVLSVMIDEPVDRFSPRLAAELSSMAQAAKVSYQIDSTSHDLKVSERSSGPGHSPSENDYALIPQYDARGACGDGALNDHVEVTGGLAFKRDWLRRMGAKPQHLFVIYATGNSMEPYIFEGDVVLFDSADTIPRDRQVYAIRRPDGSLSIKRMAQQISGSWLIRSDNPDKARYPDEEVSAASMAEVPIMGRVIWRGGAMA
jgi:phage repressor protein C with HTH and peptisase S24 domain